MLLEQFGGKQEWYETGAPQHEVELQTYYIARYPVTSAQFRSFVEDTGYKPDTERCLRGIDNHPVVHVTWHDASAYCAWLTEQLRTWEKTPEPLANLLKKDNGRIMLPSEAQWEKAARGTDKRHFPWGYEIDAEKANYKVTGVGATSTVGCFASGRSPYGIEELSGNVWEWTRTQWQQTYKNYQVNLEAEDRAVLRGGAFNCGGGGIRCTSRGREALYNRNNYIGFRIVCSTF
jgi:formylglycine-generating enzyme required for sulfatase activity